MNSEFVRSTINVDLVKSQVLSQMMLDSMMYEAREIQTIIPADLEVKSYIYAQELVCGECLNSLLSSSEFISTIHEQAMIQMDKGRLAYLNINSEPSKKCVLSKIS